MPKCKVCQKEIDTSKDKWVKPYNREYLHADCYTDWNENKNNINITRPDEFWYYALTDYLIRDLKFPVNYEKMRSQWKNFLKKGFRPKGMYFTIRYLYFVQHNNPDKALGGIGLINEDTYKEAQTYWKELHDRQEALKASQPKEVKKIVIKREEKKKPKIKYDLSKIEEWENGR